MRLLLAAIAVVLLCGEAPAAPRSFGSCENTAAISLDAQIAACTALIVEGKLPKQELALAYKRRGRAYLDRNDLDRAIADNSRAIELKPDFVDALGNRSIAYAGKGDLFRALADADAKLKIRGSAEDYFDRAGTLMMMRNFPGAIADFGQAIKLRTDYVEALTNRAYAYKNMRQLKPALADLNRALALRPNATSYTIRGDVRLGMHDTARAAQDYTLALQLQPMFAAAYLGRAHANAEATDVSPIEAENRLEGPADMLGPHVVEPGAGTMMALQDLQHAIELEPKNVEAYGFRAILLHHLGQNDLALSDYARLIALDPANAFAYGNRALVYIDKKEFEKAIGDLNRAIALAPYPAAFATRATANFKRKAYDAAIADYSRALAMAPMPSYYLARSAVFIAKGRDSFAMARTDIKAAMRGAPNSKQPYLYLGIVDYRMGDYPSALKSFEIAARYEAALDGGRGMIAPVARYMRGLTLKAMGQTAGGQADIDAARAAYAKIDEQIEERGVRRDASSPPAQVATAPTPEAKAAAGDPCKLGMSLPFEQRLKACNAAVAAASGPARVEALLQRVQVYASANDWQHVRLDSAEAIKIDPKRALSHTWLGEALANEGDLAGGIAAYGRAIAFEPLNASHWARRCWMQARLGRDLNGALADCQHALSLQPGADYLLGARGFAYLARKDYAAALADYDSMLRLTPPGVPADPYALFGRGLAKLRLGNREGARADLSAASAIEPSIAAEFSAWGLKP